MRRIAGLLLTVPLLLVWTGIVRAHGWDLPTPWNTVAAEVAPYVSEAASQQCDPVAGCISVGTGTAYRVMAPWREPGGITHLPTTVTAGHVLCATWEGIAPFDEVLSFGGYLYDPHGLCDTPSAYVPAGTDTAAWPDGLTGGLVLAPAAWPQVGGQLFFMGYGQGVPTLGILTVIGSDVPVMEGLPDGATRTLVAGVAVSGPMYGGDSGSPVVNAAGQVVGTLVAAGGQVGPAESTDPWAGIHGYLIPWWQVF